MNIVLTTYNRYEYLEPSLRSLYSSIFSQEDSIWIYDDCSTDPKIKTLLTEHSRKTPETHLHFNEQNLGCDLNVYHSIKRTFEKTNEDFIVVTDSDAIYNDQWLSFLKSQLLMYPRVGMLSVFNSPKAHAVKYEINERLVKKDSVNGLGVALNRKVFENIDPTVILSGHRCFCWDWQFITLCNNMGYDILCSKNSYIEHIGKFGVHSKGRIDLAENFLGSNLEYTERKDSLEDYLLEGYKNL